MSFFQNSGLQFFESRSVLNRELESVGFKRSKIGSKEQFRFRRSIPRGFGGVGKKKIQHTLLNFLPGSSMAAPNRRGASLPKVKIRFLNKPT